MELRKLTSDVQLHLPLLQSITLIRLRGCEERHFACALKTHSVFISPRQAPAKLKLR